MQVAFLQSSTKSTHVEPFRRIALERLVSIQITSEFTEAVQSTALKHCFSTTAVVNRVKYQFVAKPQLTRLQ